MNKIKKDQRCSFCGKAAAEVEQLLAGPETYGFAFICNECVDAGQLQMRMSRQGRATGRVETRLARPKEIMGYLNDYVIGQDQDRKSVV